MISPKDFADRWDKVDPLVPFDKESVDQLSIPAEQKQFLIEAGLPADASPFLCFEGTRPLLTVAEKWRQPTIPSRYRQIGFDGAGNLIAIDEEAEGRIVYLDHEDRFAPVFMNSSVAQLAESLLAYRSMVNTAIAANGRMRFWTETFHRDRFRNSERT